MRREEEGAAGLCMALSPAKAEARGWARIAELTAHVQQPQSALATTVDYSESAAVRTRRKATRGEDVRRREDACLRERKEPEQKRHRDSERHGHAGPMPWRGSALGP